MLLKLNKVVTMVFKLNKVVTIVFKLDKVVTSVSQCVLPVCTLSVSCQCVLPVCSSGGPGIRTTAGRIPPVCPPSVCSQSVPSVCPLSLDPLQHEQRL